MLNCQRLCTHVTAVTLTVVECSPLIILFLSLVPTVSLLELYIKNSHLMLFNMYFMYLSVMYRNLCCPGTAAWVD